MPLEAFQFWYHWKRLAVIEYFNVKQILHNRRDQPSFHAVASQYVRVEFRNMGPSQSVGPFSYEGDLVVICYGGRFHIEADEILVCLDPYDQAVVSAGTNVKLACIEFGSLQLIWSPAHAATRQG